MKINRQNYEIFIIDFYDGTLNAEEKSQLMTFLSQHPDLKAGFESYSHEPMAHTIEKYPSKKELFRSVGDKPVSSLTIDEFCIAYLENDLDDQGRKQFDQYLNNNPDAEKILNTYRKTHLQPEIHPYPYKRELKKQVTPSISYKSLIPYLAAAAIVILLVLLYPTVQTPDAETLSEQPEQPSGQLEKLTKRPAKTIPLIDNEPTPVIAHNTNRKSPFSGKEQGDKMAHEGLTKSEQWDQLHQKKPGPIPNHWENKIVPEHNIPISNILASKNKPDELSIEAVKRLFSIHVDIEKFSLWKVADAGLKGLGALAESNYSLTPNKNDNGEVESITFSTENYSIKAPVKSSDKDVTK